MDCRPHCAACCIAPSISSPIPGLPNGKPAGQRCVQLDADDRCRLFGHPDRPAVCASLQPSPAMCGPSREHAMAWITQLEWQTAPPPALRRDTQAHAATRPATSLPDRGGRGPCAGK